VTINLAYRHTFKVSPETYWRELCLSLDYQERLYREALGCPRMDVIEHVGDFETGMRRKLRFTKPIDAPAAITKIFGSAVTVEEHSEFDAKAQRWSYRIVPAMMADRIEIRGTVEIAPNAAGVEQRSTNTLGCRMFGLGAIIEHFLKKSTDEGSADKNRFTERYIVEKGLR
jgi:Protein of unknown function (DUF2505)